MTEHGILLTLVVVALPVLLYILIRTGSAAIYRSKLDYEKEKLNLNNKEGLKQNGR